jgi:protein TonB
LPTDCPSIERVGGSVTEPIELSRVQPKYPDTSGHRFSSTLFILEAVIDRSGVVHDVHFLRAPEITPPLPAFNAAIVRAISSWRYKPATLDGRPVCVYLTVTVSIHLR